MFIIIGIITGLIVSFIGSFILSLYPYLSFYPMFLATLLPSVLVFIFVTRYTKPNEKKTKSWLNGFLSLFVIGLFSFAIKSFFESRSVADNPGSSLNWDAVILFNFLYSLGAAILLSPVSYYMIKRISKLKEQD